jgi:hypothetical protein
MRIQQLNPRQFLCPSKISGFRNFGVSGFGVFGPRRFSPSLPSSTPDSRTSNLSSPGPTAQLSPTPVACGTFRRVHVTFSDVIGPTILACLLDSLARGAHPCVHVHSKEIQWLDFSQIYGTDIFGISGFRASGVRASPHLELPFAEIPKLLSTLPLDPTVKFLSYDLRCRSFRNFGFHYFATCENKVLPLWFLGCRNVVRQPHVPPHGWSR